MKCKFHATLRTRAGLQPQQTQAVAESPGSGTDFRPHPHLANCASLVETRAPVNAQLRADIPFPPNSEGSFSPSVPVAVRGS